MVHARWTEVEARGVLESWRRSGLSVERFANQRGFTPQRLYWWKKKIVLAAEPEEPKLVPVHVKREAKRGEPVTVLLRTGHMLKVAHGFDEQAFARVVALLEGT